MFRYKLRALENQEGWILVSVIVMTLFLTAIGFTIAQLVAAQYAGARMSEYTQNAQLTAEAGIEQTVNELDTNSSFTGYSSLQTFFNNSTQGLGEFTTSVTASSSGKSLTVISIGEVYQNSSATTPYVTRGVKVILVGTTSSGYSVLSGPGGLILNGSANITNSSVYVGGTITMTGAAQIGTYNQPLTVDVGNNACPSGNPPGSLYPEVCTNGSQPISLAQSTDIYGSVCATGQTSTGPNNNIQGGNGGAGLEANCTAPVASPPTYNRPAQIAAVTTTASGTSNTYVCNSWPFNRNWPANLELTGDVTIGGSCDVTINGDVWITGNLTIEGAATITVANGIAQPVIMVDGTITVKGSPQIVANSSGTGIDFISFLSADSCTTSTTAYCSSITGNELYDSQSIHTIKIGGRVDLPGMIFDAYWGEVKVGGSGNIGAVTGQTVELDGSGSVVFGTELASGVQTWSITSYEPYFPNR